MQYRIMPIIVTALVIAIGFIVNERKCSNLHRRIEFTIDFQNNFAKLVKHYFDHGNFNTEAYGKYMNDADAMQIELGG